MMILTLVITVFVIIFLIVIFKKYNNNLIIDTKAQLLNNGVAIKFIDKKEGASILNSINYFDHFANHKIFKKYIKRNHFSSQITRQSNIIRPLQIKCCFKFLRKILILTKE